MEVTRTRSMKRSLSGAGTTTSARLPCTPPRMLPVHPEHTRFGQGPTSPERAASNYRADPGQDPRRVQRFDIEAAELRVDPKSAILGRATGPPALVEAEPGRRW